MKVWWLWAEQVESILSYTGDADTGQISQHSINERVLWCEALMKPINTQHVQRVSVDFYNVDTVHALHWGSRLLTLMVCQKYCNWPESKWQDPLIAIHVMFSSEKLLRLMQIKHQTCNLSASPHNPARSLISCQNDSRRFLRWGQLSSDNVTGGERHCVSDHGLCGRGWDVDWRRA